MALTKITRGLLNTGVSDSSDATAITIDSSENVGIGTTSPDNPLHIASATPVIRLEETDASQEFEIGSFGGAFAVRDVTDNAFRVILDGDGNVGIGTTSPTVPLQINHGSSTVGLYTLGGFNYQAKFESSDAEAAIVIEDSNSTNDGNRIGVITDDMTFITANSERMRIDGSGEVGIGTTSPVAPLHIQGKDQTEGTIRLTPHSNKGSENSHIHYGSTGDWFIRSASTSGKVVINDSGGAVEIGGGNTVTSVTHSATAHTNGLNIINSQAGGYGSALKFQSERSDNNAIVTAARIRTEGAEAWNADDAVSSAFIFESVLNNSLTEKARFNSSGHLLIGVSSFGNSGGGSEIRGGLMKSSADTTSTHTHNFFTNANGAVGSIQTNGSATQFNTSSDGRLKNVTGKARGLEVINKLNPVAYNWKADGKSDEGLIAQEVIEIVPNAVSQNKENEYYQMDYSKLVTPLIKAIQEQQKEIEELKQNSHPPKTIEEMEGYEDLINRIKELENK